MHLAWKTATTHHRYTYILRCELCLEHGHREQSRQKMDLNRTGIGGRRNLPSESDAGIKLELKSSIIMTWVCQKCIQDGKYFCAFALSFFITLYKMLWTWEKEFDGAAEGKRAEKEEEEVRVIISCTKWYFQAFLSRFSGPALPCLASFGYLSRASAIQGKKGKLCKLSTEKTEICLDVEVFLDCKLWLFMMNDFKRGYKASWRQM